MSTTRSQKVPLRQIRERDLVAATRALFDERGVQDAPIEEIARAAGIARGLVYRHFSSKEELFVLTVTDYLAELAEVLEEAIGRGRTPATKLSRCAEAYARFCVRYPAFIDSALSLMRRPARDLQAIVSESVWLRLGQDMARCSDQLAEVLREGAEAGDFQVEDPDYMANFLWTSTLGAMHLMRMGVGVRQAARGVPVLFPVGPEDVVRTCVATATAAVAPN
jgi:AcrR family transcriptional regulator